ncbi:hypothetical protein KP509_07G084800 [Ceratopteris richardii]|uniref:1,3-beta-glucan synthase n=1 Tax=Ceratopteris richardii TaxID=49495 RepID=A0A8T2UGY9_CERRI|nr:hypothetical protein KP509_07G084800 [Ceratopteris richardii]
MAVRRLGTYEVGSSSNNPRTSAYNILPLNADAEICKLPEVKAARNELTRFPVKEGDDVFDLLKEKFLFQEDNIKNQREHLILLLSNARSADYDKDPASVKGKDQDLPVATVRSLFEKIMDNYWKWCSHVRIRSPDCRREEEDKQCMLKHVALYLCIWGEAANVRFLPECICFLFHNLAKLLEHQGPLYPEGQTFLTAIVTPIYEKIKEEADKGKTTNQKHSKWKNYDDFNELFWSNLLFKLPQDNPIQPSNQLHLPEDDPIQHFQHNPGQPSKIKYFKDHFEDAYKNTESKKISYVERRTFFHLYHSFVRVWILLIVLLEILVACAFSGNSLVLLLKLLICIGPTYFVMMFLKSVLDVVMMIGISVQVLSRCHVKASIIFQLLFYGACSFGTIFLYRKMILEMPPNEILLWMLVPLGAYVVIFILRHAVRRQVERMERYKFLACLNWLYRDYFYVGGRLSEKGFYYWRYALFWLLLLGCKASFSYFFQIKPLAEASKSIYPHNEIVIYQWHDLISKRNHNALALMSLWAPVILIYLLDIQIWFTVFSAVVGGILGSKDRLAEIHSLDMLRARFDTFPAELAVRLLASKKQTSAPKGIIISQAKTFSKFWNQIIKCLRNEDYIKDYEEELLIMPEGFNNYITWPLFLLAGKVSLAIKLATENPEELFERLKNDKFMSLAIREAYASASYYYDTLIDGHKDYEIKKLGIERKLSEIDKSSPDKEYKHIARIYRKVKKLVWLTDMDNQKKVNIRAVADALQSIYVDVSKFVKNEKYVQRADVRSTTMPNEIQVEDINLPANENKRTRRQKPLEPKFIRRLHWLLASTEAHSSVPKNEEAQRRLQFFTNSLFMRMPQAPSIRAMKAFSVLTPYYREPVIYSVKDLYLDNEDGISILFYLQKVFPDEWENLLERLKITEKMLTDILIKASNISTGKDAFSKSDAEKVRETRLWASYRGQTLARTVRGMMYYREALRFQACMEEREIEKNEINPEARAEALTDLKFSYVVSCQRYGEQKKHTEREEREKAEDIQELMRTHDGLRIAFVHSEGKCYYSKLIKMSDTGEQEIYKIQLPGNPILGEGKPENQNHSIIFTRGEALQAIDMNQDNYFEEALKMRNLLEQFKPPDKGPQATVLGVREHIFTGSVSSLAWFMSKQEASFVTLGQRVLARPLRVRMHYGHPDVFDRLFHLTRGGMSKASKAINVSEDVFAGFNSTMRNGNITHHEYIQVACELKKLTQEKKKRKSCYLMLLQCLIIFGILTNVFNYRK